MTKIEPATLHRSDDPRLSALSATLVGERLVSARYAVPVGVSWENYGGLEHVHEVDMGVELVTDSALVLSLSWSTPGREEGLSLALDRLGEGPPRELIDLVDVGGQSEWSGILGRLVEAVGVSFHVHADNSSVRPWAFRIEASGGSSVTVALGEVSDNALRYMPDNIVVIFDEVTAREYQIPSSTQPAWGEATLMRDTPPLWAHSPGPAAGRWHDLRDHLVGTARLARRFAAPFGGGELAYWLAALHDVGKAACGWQKRLALVADAGRGVGIDHKVLGTRIARDRGLGAFANAIYGHHGGLVDTGVLNELIKKRLADNREHVASAEQFLTRLLPDLPESLGELVPESWRDPLVGEMAVRLCYSALVDADSLDTAAHFQQLPRPRVRADVNFGPLYERFAQRRADTLAGRGGTPVARLRETVYADCLAAAEQPPGVFRLAAPTGAGKTLASAGFALRHAEIHSKRRVIVAVPFLTITEQNAGVYRALLDEEGAEPVVLEHHSQADFDDAAAGRWARLAAENWDAPFIVTTFVRLFESLYARRPAAMRRVHRLAGSVIVLDEVQALPHAMLAPILDGLRLLVTHFGATVLLCSATQPSFWALPEFTGVRCVDLIHDVPKLVADLRRVRFEWQLDPPPTLADVAAQAAAEPAALVVVNTTADAKTVFDLWRDTEPEGVAAHLSTRMCPEHRQRVLRAVRERLQRGERVLLVSTQLIEAGVDVDFPVVFRAIAPADSLLQAAGRANREGQLPGGGRVVIFASADGNQPQAYKALVDCTVRRFGPGKADPDDLSALSRYYEDVYDTLNLADRRQIGQLIQQARAELQFQTVANGPLKDLATSKRDGRLAFRMINDDGIAVVTPQGAVTPEQRRELADLIEEVRNAPVPDVTALRRLQPYTTNLHTSALKKAGVRALMRPILGTEVRRGALVEWQGDYDPHTGIDLDPHLEQFLI